MNETQELQIIQPPGAITTQSDPESILRYAIDHKADVAVIERMMVIRRELQAERAKAEYDSAMEAFQDECPIVKKSKDVVSGSDKLYSYAPFEQIVAETKECRKKYGFSFDLDTDTKSEPGWVIALCTVKHRGGHRETKSVKFPLSTGTRAMSTTQIYAAAMTFASRRVFCNAFGIVTAGEDLDGRTTIVKPAGPSKLAAEPTVKALAQELWNILKPVRGDKKDWIVANQWLWRAEVLDGAIPEEAPNLTPERFKRAIARAKELLP